MKSRTAAGEAYEDLHSLKCSVIQKFQQKYGGMWDDWDSHADEIFMSAWTRYDTKKGKFATWYAFLLYKEFMEKVRRQSMKGAKLKQVDYNLELYNKPKDSWNCIEFLRDLSEDARMVVMLVLDTPNDIKLALAERSRIESLRDKMIESIQEFLTDYGWDPDRIYSSFDEVTQALC